MKAKFSNLHPFITNNYKIDWLNQFPMKDLFEFLKLIFPTVTLDGTANFVNQSMTSIMRNQKLIFGISEKSSKRFIGVIRINFKNETARVHFNCLEKLADSKNLIEIVERMITLLFGDQINANQIYIINDANNESLYHWLDYHYKLTITSVNTKMMYIFYKDDKK